MPTVVSPKSDNSVPQCGCFKDGEPSSERPKISDFWKRFSNDGVVSYGSSPSAESLNNGSDKGTSGCFYSHLDDLDRESKNLRIELLNSHSQYANLTGVATLIVEKVFDLHRQLQLEIEIQRDSLRVDCEQKIALLRAFGTKTPPLSVQNVIRRALDVAYVSVRSERKGDNDSPFDSPKKKPNLASWSEIRRILAKNPLQLLEKCGVESVGPSDNLLEWILSEVSTESTLFCLRLANGVLRRARESSNDEKTVPKTPPALHRTRSPGICKATIKSSREAVPEVSWLSSWLSSTLEGHRIVRTQLLPLKHSFKDVYEKIAKFERTIFPGLETALFIVEDNRQQFLDEYWRQHSELEARKRDAAKAAHTIRQLDRVMEGESIRSQNEVWSKTSKLDLEVPTRVSSKGMHLGITRTHYSNALFSRKESRLVSQIKKNVVPRMWSEYGRKIEIGQDKVTKALRVSEGLPKASRRISALKEAIARISRVINEDSECRNHTQNESRSNSMTSSQSHSLDRSDDASIRHYGDRSQDGADRWHPVVWLKNSNNEFECESRAMEATCEETSDFFGCKENPEDLRTIAAVSSELGVACTYLRFHDAQSAVLQIRMKDETNSSPIKQSRKHFSSEARRGLSSTECGGFHLEKSPACGENENSKSELPTTATEYEPYTDTATEDSTEDEEEYQNSVEGRNGSRRNRSQDRTSCYDCSIHREVIISPPLVFHPQDAFLPEETSDMSIDHIVHKIQETIRDYEFGQSRKNSTPSEAWRAPAKGCSATSTMESTSTTSKEGPFLRKPTSPRGPHKHQITILVEGHADEGIACEELQLGLSWERAVCLGYEIKRRIESKNFSEKISPDIDNKSFEGEDITCVESELVGTMKSSDSKDITCTESNMTGGNSTKYHIQCVGRGSRFRISNVFGESWKNRRCQIFLKDIS